MFEKALLLCAALGLAALAPAQTPATGEMYRAGDFKVGKLGKHTLKIWMMDPGGGAGQDRPGFRRPQTVVPRPAGDEPGAVKRLVFFLLVHPDQRFHLVAAGEFDGPVFRSIQADG
jgi:hypothetical protein